MIKATARLADGQYLVVLGLSRRNTTLLHAGRPIVIDSRALGLGNGPQIMLCAGETEDAIAVELKPFIGETTVVRDEAAKDTEEA